jgi:hypothetical protein
MSDSRAIATIFGPAALELLEELIDRRVDERVATIMANLDTAPRWATIPDAARHFGLSATAMRKRVDRGAIPSALMEGRRLVDMSGAAQTMKPRRAAGRRRSELLE